MVESHTAGTSGTSFCSHCEREIPLLNYDLHFAHCKRNLERCSVCGEMVARVRADEHYNEYHAPVVCTLCGETIGRDLLISHEHDKCPQRMVACNYCEFPMPAKDLDAHMHDCGNRTEMCEPCGKYVRFCERLAHDLQYHEGGAPLESGHSRDHFLWADRLSEAPRIPGGSTSQQSRSSSKHRWFITFAIAGVAIVIGTLALQRRGPNQRQQ